MKTRTANILTTTIVLLFTIFSQAQKKPGYIPPSIDDNEEIPVAKTELPVPEEGKDYVVQYFKGITDGVESRIAVKKLGYIIRPAMVQVISEDGRELAIELVKKNWDDVVRSGTTKNGTYESSFKTALEFGIKISAKEVGIPFIVAVSAGVELFPASNLFVDAGSMRSGDANSDEAIMAGQGTGESNSLLFIIIAIALVGILALLAVLVFRKKGKGAATLILLMMTFPLNAGVVPTNLEFLGGLAENLAKGLGQHYGKGGFSGDDPLSEDDLDFEPEPDPRGQPSLPSSCYEITRMGRRGGSGGSGGDADKGFSGAKNPANSGGGITLTTGGDNGGPSGEDDDEADGKDKDFEKERQKIQNDFQHYRDLALGRMEEGKIEAQENFNRSSREASKQFDKDIREANGNEEIITQAAVNRTNTLAQLSVELSSARSQFDIDYGMDLADLAEGLAYELAALAEEEAANNEQQQNNNGGEKDPNRRPKKDPSRPDDKENSQDGDPAKGGPNPPTDQGGTPNPNGGRDRETEAGCKCLEEAYADLQKRRYSLEKLLKIGQHTKKVTDFGISFGDDFSGVHGVSGLVWQTKRAEVLKSIDQFDITYNNKYNELIDKLYDALIQIDECELKLGYENWYSQSGFIYYEFMKVRYASYK